MACFTPVLWSLYFRYIIATLEEVGCASNPWARSISATITVQERAISMRLL